MSLHLPIHEQTPISIPYKSSSKWHLFRTLRTDYYSRLVLLRHIWARGKWFLFSWGFSKALSLGDGCFCTSLCTPSYSFLFVEKYPCKITAIIFFWVSYRFFLSFFRDGRGGSIILLLKDVFAVNGSIV